MDKTLNNVTAILLYKFKNQELLIKALTHPSKEKNFEFQRLEFLGDKLLNFYVCEEIFLFFKEKNEGELSILLSHLISANIISYLVEPHIASYIRYTGVLTPSMIGDTFEAIIGAIYLDGGNVKNIILTLWKEYIIANTHTDFKNPKNILQEITHHQYNYNIIESPKKLQKKFTVEISKDGIKAQGEGLSKKEASTNSAINLLNKLQKK